MIPLADYLKSIGKNLASGDATEHTHRPALKSLIESLAAKVTATNEPKRIECEIETPTGRTLIVRTVWIVDTGESNARLVTAYPHED